MARGARTSKLTLTQPYATMFEILPRRCTCAAADNRQAGPRWGRQRSRCCTAGTVAARNATRPV